MNARDVQLLESAEGYPSISVYIPLHPAMPERKIDAVVVRKVVEAVRAKVQDAALVSRVESALLSVVATSHARSIALFVQARLEKLFQLPLQVPELVVVDDDFYIKPLLQAQAVSKPYWVLELNPAMTRLYHAICDSLHEIHDPKTTPMGAPHQGFPIAYVYEDKTFERAKLAHDKVASYDDAHKRTFLKRVDDLLADHMMREPLPLVLIGDVENRALFTKITQHGRHIIAQVDGDYEKNQHRALEQKVWDAVGKARRADEAKITAQIDEAVGREHAAVGLHHVWRVAHEGRIHRLFVEEGYSVPGGIVPETGTYVLYDPVTHTDHADDLINNIIEQVLRKGGSVEIVSHEALKKFEHIAAILRY